MRGCARAQTGAYGFPCGGGLQITRSRSARPSLAVGIAVNLDIVVGYVLMAGITRYLAVRKTAEETETAVIPAAAEVATP